MKSSEMVASVNAVLKAAGLSYSAKFIPAEDESVDDEIEISLAGAPSRFAIQVCLHGEFVANEYLLKNGNIAGMRDGPVREKLEDAAADLVAMIRKTFGH